MSGETRYAIKPCLLDATLRLQAISDSARIDAEVLLAHILEKDRSYLFTWPEKELSPEQHSRWCELLNRRLNGEPVAYILGEKEFWSLPLYVNTSTLIPRGDTEVLVEKALVLLGESEKQGNGKKRILDLGTGTGAIALALACERRDYHVDAVDFSSDAVALAKKNQIRNAIKNITIFESDWFSQVNSQYHMIVSNPPYIDADDEHLQQGDVIYEPHTALIARDHGLGDIRHITEQAKGFLCAGGYLLVEHGWQQAEYVQEIFRAESYGDVNTIQDYSGNDRVTYGQMR